MLKGKDRKNLGLLYLVESIKSSKYDKMPPTEGSLDEALHQSLSLNVAKGSRKTPRNLGRLGIVSRITIQVTLGTDVRQNQGNAQLALQELGIPICRVDRIQVGEPLLVTLETKRL